MAHPSADNPSPEAFRERPTPERQAAFLALFRPHIAKLRCSIRTRLAYSRRHLVDDVLQEVTLRAWQNLHRLEIARSAEAYLQGIAQNVIVDLLRSPSASLQSLDVDLPDDAPTPDALVAQQEQSHQVAVALQSLAERHRQALELKHQGLTHREIAQKLGGTEKAIKRLIARSRERLAEQLGLLER